ncbi:MAG: glucosaminidase domain-containing protein [bacterium]|nr:glucosaminidase domain-containing protein [Candidatus Colousia faecequi]
MKRAILSAVVLMSALRLTAQNRLPEYDSYIETYKQFAIDSRERYGIPAAITMAQGILESAAGNSDLATDCNNHFGIKCGSSWYGKTMTKDDDSSDECFRCYSSAQASFDDHSEFLRRQRYAFLFDYAVTDYGSWAQGLRQAGYATDPAYPQKLIAIIENYELYLLDGGKNLALSEKTATEPREDVYVAENGNNSSGTADQSRTTAKTDTQTEVASTVTGKPDLQKKADAKIAKQPSTTKAGQNGEVIVDKTAMYEISDNNGVRCILLTGDATFKHISKLTDISIERLLYLNDLPSAVPLHAGDWVYLSWKKGQADKSLPVYTVKSGDSMHSISQQFGIRLSALYKLNNMEYGTPARVGQQLKLHK